MQGHIVISGASGLIGNELTRTLTGLGYDVHTLVRRDPRTNTEHSWNPSRGTLDPEILRGAEAVISLGGASVGRLPWTKRYRRTLWDSRMQTTRTIAHAIRSLGKEAPRAWLSASAVGYYGNTTDEPATEPGVPGETFLARLCVAWENEALAATDLTRVVLLRTAPVIHPDGVLKPMIRMTNVGLGGPLGTGSQWWPWISLTDEVRAIVHALTERIAGPVNLTGPTLATQADIGRALAKHLHRPFFVPAPKFAVKLALGRDATESLLTVSAKVLPQTLLDTGFTFTHDTPDAAIERTL